MSVNSDILKVVFFGDSICYGQHVSIHDSWVARISLEVEKSGINACVTNSSVNGRTTRQALEDMPYHIQNQKPDILIVQFGMNDCNYWVTDRGLPRVSEKGFSANLEEIINRAWNFGAKSILINSNHPTGLTQSKFPYTNITYEESNKKYNCIIRDVVANNNVIFKDIEKIFLECAANITTLLSPDLLHLNKNGHQLYFDSIFPILMKEIGVL